VTTEFPTLLLLLLLHILQFFSLVVDKLFVFFLHISHFLALASCLFDALVHESCFRGVVLFKVYRDK